MYCRVMCDAMLIILRETMQCLSEHPLSACRIAWSSCWARRKFRLFIKQTLYTSIYIYIYIYTHYIYIYTHVCIIYVLRMYILCIYVCMYVYMYVASVCKCVCMYVACVRKCVYMYVCMHLSMFCWSWKYVSIKIMI